MISWIGCPRLTEYWCKKNGTREKCEHILYFAYSVMQYIEKWEDTYSTLHRENIHDVRSGDVLCFSVNSKLYIPNTTVVWRLYWPLPLAGYQNSLFKTNYLWPTLWSTSLKSAFFSFKVVAPLWHKLVVIFVFTVPVRIVLDCSETWFAVKFALCRQWYFESILLWPYWFDCQSPNRRHILPSVYGTLLPEQALISSASNEVHGCSFYI